MNPQEDDDWDGVDADCPLCGGRGWYPEAIEEGDEVYEGGERYCVCATGALLRECDREWER